MSTYEHKVTAYTQVKCKIITVSDTRDKETDKSGRTMKVLLEKSGHIIVDYEIVKDEKKQIHAAILQGIKNEETQVILLNGGTGIAKRDVTIEVVQELSEKEIPGFGEIFRMLSYQEDIGSAAILSRAIAGVCCNKAIFATPGSTGAVILAMNKLILPEIGHIVSELAKDH